MPAFDDSYAPAHDGGGMDYPRVLRALLTALSAEKGRKVNQDELARLLKVTQPNISRWIRGTQEPDKDADARIVKLGQKYGLVSTDRQITNAPVAFPGAGAQPMSATAQIVGYVGGGAEAHFYNEGQGPFGEAIMPPDAGEKTVAVVVRGNSMAPEIRDGSTLYYQDKRDPPTDDLIGELCVVGLSDDKVLVKYLQKSHSPGLFDLYSVDGATIPAQRVAWAAPVEFIRPPRRSR